MKRVLVLEDNLDTLDLLTGLVREVAADVKVFSACRIEEAYAYAMKYTMDVFIVDIILEHGKKGGDMSGAGFIQKIRGIKKYFFTPIIVVTSLYDTKQYLYSETHCFKFVEKPFSVAKMKEIIEDALGYTTKNERDAMWFYKLEGMVGAVPINEIIYARSKRQEMDVVTVHERVHISYKTCNDLLEELDVGEFEMCKRGVLVNKKYIRRIDAVNRYIYLRGCDDVLEIGPVMKKRFLHWFYET